MNVTINHLLTQDSCTLEVFADYLEERAPPTCDRNLYLFLRTRQHEEKGFSDVFGRKEGDGYSGWGNGDGQGDGDGYHFGFGYGNGYGDGCGSSYGDANGGGYGDGDRWNQDS
jgi:hypothetical protein